MLIGGKRSCSSGGVPDRRGYGGACVQGMDYPDAGVVG
jgi:hypothetical protein